MCSQRRTCFNRIRGCEPFRRLWPTTHPPGRRCWSFGISEPDRGRRHWTGKAAARKAVYANRRRIRGARGHRLLRQRGELQNFRKAWVITVLRTHGVKPKWRKKGGYRHLTRLVVALLLLVTIALGAGVYVGGLDRPFRHRLFESAFIWTRQWTGKPRAAATPDRPDCPWHTARPISGCDRPGQWHNQRGISRCPRTGHARVCRGVCLGSTNTSCRVDPEACMETLR